jgi:hypothetical protein
MRASKRGRRERGSGDSVKVGVDGEDVVKARGIRGASEEYIFMIRAGHPTNTPSGRVQAEDVGRRTRFCSRD